MNKLYVVMPAYNEEANIEAVIRSWYAVLEGKDEASRLVVANNGSTDGTEDILKNLQKEMPQLEIFNDSLKQHGPKVIALYKYAIEKGADYVFQTDSDGQTNPAEFDAFWQDRDSYDAIIGNRTVRGDGKMRAFIEHVVCFLLNVYFGVKVPDANAPFRLINTKALNKYLDKLPYDYNIPNIMLTMYFVRYKERVDFREISFAPRLAGENSVNMKSIIKHGIRAMHDFHEFKKDMK